MSTILPPGPPVSPTESGEVVDLPSEDEADIEELEDGSAIVRISEEEEAEAHRDSECAPVQ